MTEAEKLRHCIGCRDDVYNHGDASDTGRCWKLPAMKIVLKKEVHVDQRPPWLQKARRFPQCYHRPRHVYVGPNQTQ